MQTILAIDDETGVLQSYKAILEPQYRLLTTKNAQEGLEILADSHVDLILLDLMMPIMTGNQFLAEHIKRGYTTPVIVVSGMNSVEMAVDAMRQGARDFLIKPFDIDQLAHLIDRVVSEEKHKRELEAFREQDSHGFEALIGVSPRMQEIFQLARQAAEADATVLITGESGTGKDMMARAIHSAGSRAAQPFVHVSCCALPEQLVESELFGHERGAFTGAVDRRIGKVQVADGGTLFLDEIGEMPLATQGKLLQVLQDSRFYAVGSNKAIDVDVRFICATNRDLAEAIKRGTFRQDLFYRINVVNVEMPPLRRRREDISLLADHFLRKHKPRVNTHLHGFSTDAQAALASYSWPGNVRELENVIQRLLVLHRNEEILDASHVRPVLQPESETGPMSGLEELEGLPLQDAVARLERHLIERALERSGNVQSRAAEMLGTTRRILKYKMDQLEISAGADEEDAEATRQEAS